DIPVIANGEIWNSAHAQHCMTQSGTQRLMLGRGAVTHPALITKIDADNNDTKMVTVLAWQDLNTHQIKFLEGAAKNDAVLDGHYKQWVGRLTKGYSEAQTWRERNKREKNKAVIIAALQKSTCE